MRELGVVLLSAREATRSRFAIVVALLLAGGAAGLMWGASGDGTAAGRLAAFLSWGSGLSWVLLSLAAVFLSTSFGRAIMDGRVVPLALAPVDRVRLLLAWWAGVALVLLGLTALAALTLGLLAQAALLLAPTETRPRLERVLSARGVVRSAPPELGAAWEGIAAELERRARAGTLPEDLPLERARELELERFRLGQRTVAPGRTLAWTFAGVEPDPGARELELRFYFFVQDPEGRLPPGRGPRGRWAVHPIGSDGYADLDGTWGGVSGYTVKKHELAIPVEFLEGRTAVMVRYQNLEERPITVLFPEQGPELRFPAGSFGPNLLRAGLVLWARLLFLGALGVAASALLDPKLGALVVLFFLAVGSGHEFLLDALRPSYEAFGHTLGPPLRGLLTGVLWAIPDLSREDLAQRLAEGERVTPAEVGRALLGDGAGRGGAILLLGAWLFSRRELGAVRGG